MNGYSQSSEPVRFERDCAAIMVPQGQEVILPAGQTGYITQALGGSFTVFVDGNLFRISGENADALGKDQPEPLVLSEGAGDSDVERLVWQQLRTCYDPEIPVNIVDLGLVYDCQVTPLPEGGNRVDVKMTLTAPGCGMGGVIASDAEQKIREVPGVSDVHVEVVWDPIWNQSMMSDAARLQLGLM